MRTVGEVCLLTADVRRLSAFYRMLLGIESADVDCMHQTLLERETMLTVMQSDSARPGSGQSIALAFTVSDVDAECARLRTLGVEIVQEPRTQPWGARNMCLRDPDGNLVYLRTLP